MTRRRSPYAPTLIMKLWSWIWEPEPPAELPYVVIDVVDGQSTVKLTTKEKKDGLVA